MRKAKTDGQVILVDRLEPQLGRAADAHRGVLVQRLVALEQAFRFQQADQLGVPGQPLREVLGHAMDITRAEGDDDGRPAAGVRSPWRATGPGSAHNGRGDGPHRAPRRPRFRR